MAVQDITTPAEKQCTKCQQIKPFDEFPIEPRSKGGFQSRCYECFRAKQQARRNLLWERRVAKKRTRERPAEMALQSKRCARCDVVKLGSQFPANRCNKDGLHSYCSECNKEICRANNQRRKLQQPRRRTIPSEKQCVKCERLLPVGRFLHSRRLPDGLRATCKECQLTNHVEERRRDNLDKYYGISLEQYGQMERAQEGQCAICGSLQNGKSLAVDHDHRCCKKSRTCGKCMRGLLCENCNLGLGQFHDSPKLLEKAIAYLRSYSAE